VTPADILEAVAGAFESHSDEDDGSHTARRRLVAAVRLDAGRCAAEHLGLALPPKRNYRTVAASCSAISIIFLPLVKG
jgi:CBS domain containing-hemolysin-like protein